MSKDRKLILLGDSAIRSLENDALHCGQADEITHRPSKSGYPAGNVVGCDRVGVAEPVAVGRVGKCEGGEFADIRLRQCSRQDLVPVVAQASDRAVEFVLRDAAVPWQGKLGPKAGRDTHEGCVKPAIGAVVKQLRKPVEHETGTTMTNRLYHE